MRSMRLGTSIQLDFSLFCLCQHVRRKEEGSPGSQLLESCQRAEAREISSKLVPRDVSERPGDNAR